LTGKINSIVNCLDYVAGDNSIFIYELGSMLQKEVMVSFKIQCCYLPGVSEDNHEKSVDSLCTWWMANCKLHLQTPPFLFLNV